MDIYVQDFFYVWLIVAMMFLFLEVGSPGLFYFLSFFIGGLAASITTYITDSLCIQTLFFFMTSICAFIGLRYLIFPILSKGRPYERTNVHALIGKRAFVERAITEQKPGLVVLENSRWIACSVNNELIEKGAIVEVVKVRGGHVVVKSV